MKSPKIFVSKARSSPPWWECLPPHPAGSRAAAWQHRPQPADPQQRPRDSLGTRHGPI